jgi:nucleolar protein 53
VLFSLDVDGDIATERRLAKKSKPLKSDEILATRSAVPAVDTRKRASGFVTDGVAEKKKKRKDGVSFAQLQRLRAIAYGGASSAPAGVLASSKTVPVPDYDPWGDEAVDKFKKKADIELEQLDFVEKKNPIEAPKTLKHKPIALTATGSVPAVRLPEAGISYNPEFEKWEALLREEGEKEVEVEKKRLAEEAKAARIQALVEASDEEMESDKEEWEDGDEEEEGDEEEDSENKERKEVKRKTQAQRNKESRQKEQERAREAEKKTKQLARELMLVKKYTKEIKRQEKLRMEKAIAKKTALRDDKKSLETMRKKKFGKVPYVLSPTLVNWKSANKRFLQFATCTARAATAR